MTTPSRYTALRQQIADALPHVRRGVAIPWTLGIAAYSLYAVFATGDLNQIIPFVTGIGGGLLGDTLLGWATSGQQPSEDEIAALLETTLAQGETTNALLADLDGKLGLLDLIYQHIQEHPDAGADLLTAAELREQMRLFGASLDDNFRQMRDRLDRLEEILSENAHDAWRQRHFDLPVEPPGPPPVFVGRKDELNQLHGFLGAVAAGKMQGCLLFVHGRPGIGKRELVRQWLADVAKDNQSPIIARTTFLPDELSTLARIDYYRTHPVWELDWTRYGDQLRRYFPQDFLLGSYPWLALAVQLAAQCTAIQTALHDHHADLTALKVDSGQPPWRAITRLLRLAAQDGRPVIIVLEHFHRAELTWDTKLRAWVQEIAQARLPILLIVECDYPRSLVEEQEQEILGDRVSWFHQRYTQPHYREQAVYLSELRPDQVGLFLAADSQEWAAALHNLTGGIPGLIETLLHHWRVVGVAVIDGDGKWHIDGDAAGIFPGELYDYLIAEPLEDAAVAAQEMGYESVTADTLLDWLKYAVWEGAAFTDDALARAVNWHDDALEDFQILLDDALVRSEENPAGPLTEIPEPVALPYGDNQMRYYARYEFAPPVVATILRERQDLAERRHRGHAYAQVLDAAYAPHQDRVLNTLIWIYDAIGLPKLASSYRLRSNVFTTLAAMEVELPILDALAADWLTQSILLTRILAYARAAYRILHPQRIIGWLERALTLARTLPDRRGEASTLQGLARVYADLGEQGRAQELLNQALPIFREVGDRRGEASSLHGLAVVYSGLGEQGGAQELLNQALPIFREMGDRRGEASSLHGLAVVYSGLGEQGRAQELLNQALPIFREVGDRSGEASILQELASVYADLGKKGQAQELFNQALPIFREVGDRSGEASTLQGLASVYSDLGEKGQAQELFNQALPIFREVGNRRGEASTLHGLASVYADLGELGWAQESFNQALPIFREVGDRRGEASTLHGLASVYSYLGEKGRAQELFNQALPIFREMGDRRGEASTLHGLASVYADLGEQGRAQELLNQALPIFREVGDRSGEASSLHGLAIVYADLGEQGRAQELFNQALPIFREVGDRRREASALQGLASVYADLGEKGRAQALFNQALPIFREVGDRSGEASALQGLASVYSDLREQGRAQELFNQALPIFREVGDRSGEASTPHGLASVYSDLGEKEQALAFYKQVLLNFRKVGDLGNEARTLCDIAVLQIESTPEGAAKRLRSAISLARSVHSRAVEALALHHLGIIYVHQGADTAAASSFQTALTLRQAIQDHFGEIDTRLAYARVLIHTNDLTAACSHLTAAANLARQYQHPQLEAILDLQAKHCS